MDLEIITTTDGRHVGLRINTGNWTVNLGDTAFTPDRVWSIGVGLWRLANSNYVIDAQEI